MYCIFYIFFKNKISDMMCFYFYSIVMPTLNEFIIHRFIYAHLNSIQKQKLNFKK